MVSKRQISRRGTGQWRQCWDARQVLQGGIRNILLLAAKWPGQYNLGTLAKMNIAMVLFFKANVQSFQLASSKLSICTHLALIWHLFSTHLARKGKP
jgi:hypothetical protein